jgi:NADH-quinone oxidoreductase subunit N
METLQINLMALLPELILVVTVVVIMLLDAFGKRNETEGTNAALPWIALGGVAAATGVCLWLWSQPPVTFQGQATNDTFSLALRMIVYVATALTILLSGNYIHKVNVQEGEYYSLLLLAAIGMGVMGAATDLIVLFLALEVFSLALYILTGLDRHNPRSTEAAMKYFLLGAFASAFLVYGAALLYGSTGSTQYGAIADSVSSGAADPILLAIGTALMIVGLGFKVSIVPFHMWTPDVYQGAPMTVTAFMSVGTKAAAFAAFARLFAYALPDAQAMWGLPLAILAILSMFVGNLAALRQTSLKRMLAYSSIAHAGYILTAIVPGTVQGADAALFYLFTYAFMNIGAFAVLMTLEKHIGYDVQLSDVSGLSNRHPLLALLMSIFMFSLTGVPPMAGFFGKVAVFGAAVDGGYAWLAALGMVASIIGAYYYLRVVVRMYFDVKAEADVHAHGDAKPVRVGKAAVPAAPAEVAIQPRLWGSLQIGLAIAAAFTIVVGVLPSFWMNILQSAFGG